MLITDIITHVCVRFYYNWCMGCGEQLYIEAASNSNNIFSYLFLQHSLCFFLKSQSTILGNSQNQQNKCSSDFYVQICVPLSCPSDLPLGRMLNYNKKVCVTLYFRCQKSLIFSPSITLSPCERNYSRGKH